VSCTPQIRFTPDMDHALLTLRGTIPMPDVAAKVGVSMWSAYRRLRKLKQPIQKRRRWSRQG
jgi:hypothetical protein